MSCLYWLTSDGLCKKVPRKKINKQVQSPEQTKNCLVPVFFNFRVRNCKLKKNCSQLCLKYIPSVNVKYL